MFAAAIIFLRNCLLNACTISLFCPTIVGQELKLSTGFLKHIACTIEWRNTPVLPKNLYFLASDLQKSILNETQMIGRIFHANKNR
jgi:hypothetical protein